ncbi:hypothetical protein [Necropsobacter massiliensis]|uniref:hypothetical protein n=1 Tax=Necropsobacter massiliensis TaxID=1400001 RepID=UPI000595C345|nr:hypothetical protein [Necropsobacter massiliensis]
MLYSALASECLSRLSGTTTKHAEEDIYAKGKYDTTELQLSAKDAAYLKETYQPHRLAGIMAQNTPQTKDVKQAWTR